jgi:hypothetical protein
VGAVGRRGWQEVLAMRTPLTAVALLACAISCSSSTREGPTPGQHAVTAAPPREAAADLCPLAVPQTTLSASDVEGGEALTFTTASSQVDELRSRVHGMAEVHARHHAEGGGPGGMGPPPSSTEAEDVSGGARIVLRPKDPGDLERLRAFARDHAERMQREGCAGMGAHPGS